MARELSIQITESIGPDGGVMVVTGLRAGHAPALAAALEEFVRADKARFPNGGQSGVGWTAEDFLKALNKERGF